MRLLIGGRCLSLPREVARPPFVHYWFAHGLGRIAPREALHSVRTFMDQFAEPSIPSCAWLLLDMAADKQVVLNRAFRHLRSKYGWRYERSRGYGTDGSVFRAFRWPVRLSAVESALAEVEALIKQDELLAERVRLQLYWAFKWRDPDTRRILADQDEWPSLDVRQVAGSSLLLTLGRTSTAASWFYLPFDNGTDLCRNYVKHLQAALPYRLSDKHWCVWRQASTGRWRSRHCNPLA